MCPADCSMRTTIKSCTVNLLTDGAVGWLVDVETLGKDSSHRLRLNVNGECRTVVGNRARQLRLT